MANVFKNRPRGLGDPCTDMVPVTPHATDLLPNVATSLYIETGGYVAFLTPDSGATVRIVKVSDFATIVCGVTAVRTAGTTATGIHAYIGN